MVAQHSENIVIVYIFGVLPTNIYMQHNYVDDLETYHAVDVFFEFL